MGYDRAMTGMPTRRALLGAALPGLFTFIVFWLSLGVALPAAFALGVLWAAGSLLVTRLIYDDAEAEQAAWVAEAPDLAELKR